MEEFNYIILKGITLNTSLNHKPLFVVAVRDTNKYGICSYKQLINNNLPNTDIHFTRKKQSIKQKHFLSRE